MDESRIVQTGTLQQIFHQPSTDYFQWFVAQINPLQALTAQDILLRSAVKTKQKSTTISQHAHTPASVIMSLLHDHDGPVTVTRAGYPLGQIDRNALLACLTSYNQE